MDDHYKTLQTIYTLASEDPQPETYKCRPREIILNQTQSWTSIEKNLKQLEAEGMVRLRKEDTVVIFITKEGIERIKTATWM